MSSSITTYRCRFCSFRSANQLQTMQHSVVTHRRQHLAWVGRTTTPVVKHQEFSRNGMPLRGVRFTQWPAVQAAAAVATEARPVTYNASTQVKLSSSYPKAGTSVLNRPKTEARVDQSVGTQKSTRAVPESADQRAVAQRSTEAVKERNSHLLSTSKGKSGPKIPISRSSLTDPAISYSNAVSSGCVKPRTGPVYGPVPSPMVRPGPAVKTAEQRPVSQKRRTTTSDEVAAPKIRRNVCKVCDRAFPSTREGELARFRHHQGVHTTKHLCLVCALCGCHLIGAREFQGHFDKYHRQHVSSEMIPASVIKVLMGTYSWIPYCKKCNFASFQLFSQQLGCWCPSRRPTEGSPYCFDGVFDSEPPKINGVTYRQVDPIPPDFICEEAGAVFMAPRTSSVSVSDAGMDLEAENQSPVPKTPSFGSPCKVAELSPVVKVVSEAKNGPAGVIETATKPQSQKSTIASQKSRESSPGWTPRAGTSVSATASSSRQKSVLEELESRVCRLDVHSDDSDSNLTVPTNLTSWGSQCDVSVDVKPTSTDLGRQKGDLSSYKIPKVKLSLNPDSEQTIQAKKPKKSKRRDDKSRGKRHSRKH